MKKMLALILMLFAVSCFAQNLIDKGNIFYWRYVSPATDSAGTFASGTIDASAIINLYVETAVDTGEVDSDTKLVYHFDKRPYFIVQVYGTVNDTMNGSDSLSSLYLKGRTPANDWVTIDTIATNGETSHQVDVTYNDLAKFTELRLDGTVADLAAETDYDVITYIELIIPKQYK